MNGEEDKYVVIVIVAYFDRVTASVLCPRPSCGRPSAALKFFFLPCMELRNASQLSSHAARQDWDQYGRARGKQARTLTDESIFSPVSESLYDHLFSIQKTVTQQCQYYINLRRTILHGAKPHYEGIINQVQSESSRSTPDLMYHATNNYLSLQLAQNRKIVSFFETRQWNSSIERT